MSSRIKRDRNGQPIRNSDGNIIRTKPHTKTGEMITHAEWTTIPSTLEEIHEILAITETDKKYDRFDGE